MISKMSMFSLKKLATYITSHVFLWLCIMRKCIFAMWFLVSYKLKTMVVKTEQVCKMQQVVALCSKYDKRLISE